ncbi:MAG: universal stress protein [Dehalococcoidia bacterium]
MYEKILYPTDGSELSRLALPHVVAIARALGIPVAVLEAVEIVTEADAMTVPERREEAERCVTDITASLEAQGVTVAGARVVEGDAGRSILNAVAEEGADLVIMATRGNSGLRRLALGSVAEHVMTRAPCAVLLVRPPHHD